MPIVGFLVPTVWRDHKSGMKNYSRFYPRKPLKSLGPDEGIQRNPRKTNPIIGRLLQRNGDAPRKSKLGRPD
jgi:hypothetical protein